MRVNQVLPVSGPAQPEYAADGDDGWIDGDSAVAVLSAAVRAYAGEWNPHDAGCFVRYWRRAGRVNGPAVLLGRPVVAARRSVGYYSPTVVLLGDPDAQREHFGGPA